MNWYIGQEVVCVRTHSQGKFKEGEIFRIVGLKAPICSCGVLPINIGKTAQHDTDRCPVCNTSRPNNDGVHWFSEKYFAPLMDISELESILKEETINK